MAPGLFRSYCSSVVVTGVCAYAVSYFPMPPISGNNAQPNLISTASFAVTRAAAAPDDVCARARPDCRAALPCTYSTDIGTMVPCRRTRHFRVVATSTSIGTFCHNGGNQMVCRRSRYSPLYSIAAQDAHKKVKKIKENQM